MGQGGEYFAQQKRNEEEENLNQNPYMDRSAALRATLNSLAMMNVANVINNKKKSILEDKEEKKEERKKSEKEVEELEKILQQTQEEASEDFQNNEYN